jgi:anthranilate phosphoribosyltransferase
VAVAQRRPTHIMIKEALAKLIDRKDLTADEAATVMEEIMSGAATPAQIGAYLAALRMKGEAAAEISGSARTMRGKALRVTHQQPRVVDLVGTGGDGAGTFNITTTAAFVVAGAGVPVAKHGSRSASSQVGSADVLAVLGVFVETTPEQVARCVDELGVGFMFAPVFHPAMKAVVGPRREMGVRTIFNILGPLTNPAWVQHQLIGVAIPELTEVMAHTLRDLGSKHALVVNTQGVDELLPIGESKVTELIDGQIKTYMLDTRTLGFEPVSIDQLGGGSADFNAAIVRSILAGDDVQARTDAVVLNAAAALYAADAVPSFAGGVDLARASIRSGAALKKLDALIALTQSFAPPPSA